MALEELLKENTAAVLAQNELLAKMLDATTSGAATAASGNDDNDGDDASTKETPKRKRGEPSPGKARRTKAEIAEDEAADAADAAAAKGDDTSDDGDVTFDSVKGKLAKWLGEFAKEEDKESPEGTHPEVLARKAALKAVLNKLTGTDDGKLGAISGDAEKVAKLDNWFETKAKVADKGHGIGRLAADPAAADAGDDELDI